MWRGISRRGQCARQWNRKRSNLFWNGATVRMRTADRKWEIASVTSFANDSIIFQPATFYNIENGFGFYLDNLFSLLDTANEWFYNISDGKIYFNAPGNSNPSSM